MVSAEGNPVAGQTSGIISLGFNAGGTAEEGNPYRTGCVGTAGFNAGGTADHCKISVPEYSHVFRDFLRCPEMIKSYDY